ncbi:Alpha/beta hydrolase family protein [Tsuneonella dongtanensis]|uniref:Palmitoyl-protein thioesterase ABHD10, mitochondrial n=1 Tax=Tsuneonella dongtanensis TaxID=692370 RepID=A0A1B2A9Y3_9SPHN|nr:alpha/beta hydrolase [Tsuneonella dongtanensis]ANY18904.1 Alpha/beta hydrolase family protein [Tsuneonella dongtanensis]
MADLQFHDIDGRRIAFRYSAGEGPAIVFLPGYMSDMAGGKATAVFDWAVRNGRTCLLLDYSGCGESAGDFADGTLSRWRDEVLALVEDLVDGPVILVGSSMGGWLMLLVGRALSDRLKALVGIAAAPDFTDWGYDTAQKAALANDHVVFEDNPYGPDPTPTHPGFWADGQAQRQLNAEIPFDCPVRLIHGMRDEDVPYAISQRLSAMLRSPDVHLTLVKDGDHRLSREADIDLLLRTIEAL